MGRDMRAEAFWRTVVADQSDFLSRVIELLTKHAIRYCVIGGQGVNAYAEPVVSLDLDIAIAVDQLSEAEDLLSQEFRVQRFPHGLNVSAAGSDLRIQIQTDPRYGAFLAGAKVRDILGLRLPVASVEDMLQGKIWAVLDAGRRASKRQKDLPDIARLLEAYPDLRSRVPEEILARLV
jgi:predicted nucleotidyltransferase